MFEFRDKNLGALKFVSVSEARARFADCLKEESSNIVVTRHGVPYKVFVSYEDYMSLKQAAQQITESDKISITKTLENAQKNNESAPIVRTSVANQLLNAVDSIKPLKA